MTVSTPVRLLRQRLDQDPQLRTRLLFVFIELLLIAFLAAKASQLELTMVLLLPVAVGLILVFLRWPPLGLIIAFLGGLLVPFFGRSGLNVTLVLVGLLLLLWLLGMLVRRNHTAFVPSRTVLPLLFLVLAAAFSFGLGQLPWLTFAQHAPLGAQLGGLSIIVLSAGTFLVAANQIRDLRWLSGITWAFLAIGTVSIVIRSVLPVIGLPTRGWLQPVGPLFYIWLAAIAFSQAIFNKDLHPRWRLALWGLVVLALAVLFIEKFGDKSGWLSVLVCLAAIIGARSWRAGIALAAVAGLAALYLYSGLAASEAYSISTRSDAWAIMFQIIKVSPLWGLGFANYYWYTPLFPIRGYAVSFNSHNNYMDIVAQMGLFGLLFFLWLLWELGRLGWRLRNQAPAGFAQAYVYGAMGGLAGMAVAGMFGDWVLPFFYNVGLNGFRTSMLGWLFLGGLVSVEQVVAAQKAKASHE